MSHVTLSLPPQPLMSENLKTINGKSVYFAEFENMISPSELEQGVKHIFDFCCDKEVFLIYADCSKLEGGHSVFDLYSLASSLASAPESYRFKEAILINESTKSKDNVRFWETACLNKGFRVKIFNDSTTAMSWLTE